MADHGPAPTRQRVVALAVLLVGGILSLPLVATVLDGDSTEAWVVPVQLLLMAVVGAVVGRLLPGLAGAAAPPARGAAVGALVGVVCALLAATVFMLLLGGP
jgi:hypothetical protein